MRLTPLEWGLRAPITPRLGGNRWALPRLGKSELNEEKQIDSKHKTSDTSPGRGAPSPGAACGASATPSCSCPVQEPVGGQARSFHSSGWSCATSLETIPSGEDECLETRFPRAPTLASDSLCKAKVRAKSAKHSRAGIEGNESLPASATRKDIADTRHRRKSASPVPPMCADNPRPLQTAISWGRLSQVNSPILN